MSRPRIGNHDKTRFKIQRDEIHVPILLVRSMVSLLPGEKVNVTQDSVGDFWISEVPYGTEYVGVVDPFLEKYAPAGEFFYCFLKPNSVKELWHEWKHPKVDK